jgi:hypothetical protein
MSQAMVSRRSIVLTTLLAVVAGLLAGLDFDRTSVASPACLVGGAPAWAPFTRHADLGPGLILYPLEAVAGLLLAAAATASRWFEHRAANREFLALLVASAGAVAGLVATAFAAPVMLGIATQADPAMLQQSLDAFQQRGDVRGAFQLVTFVAAVIALALFAMRVNE